MTAYLTYSTGTGIERVACASVVTMGRDKNNDIVLSDLHVSRNHAMVRRLGEADYYLIDGGSANGSRVNQRRITTPTLLCNGDRIVVGNTEFVFEQAPRPTTFTESISFQATMLVHSPLIKEITILVADIRGFTTLSEQLPIQALTKFMTEWFNRVGDVITEHGGVVDKFIGDCVFARWDREQPQDNVIDALRTACLISALTTELSATLEPLPQPLRIGVGIHTGLASLGIGSDNTALGDSVNTAFRLETASKELATDIVLSESAYAHLPETGWRDDPRQVKLKGKAKPVNVVGLDFPRAQELLARLKR